MPTIDRNLLRLAAYELLCVDDVPNAVAISEAVRLAGDLSTDSSAHFVNGVLSSVDRTARRWLRPSSDRSSGLDLLPGSARVQADEFAAPLNAVERAHAVSRAGCRGRTP